jgi:hypothetical protein
MPFQRCQRLLNGKLTFFKASCACRLGEVVAWHLVGKRGGKADPWERGGLRFDSGKWGLIP